MVAPAFAGADCGCGARALRAAHPESRVTARAAIVPRNRVCTVSVFLVETSAPARHVEDQNHREDYQENEGCRAHLF